MNSWHIAKNLIRRTVQGKKGILLYLIVPSIVISMFIGILGKETSTIANIGYINHDHGSLGDHLINQLALNTNYHLILVDSNELLKNKVVDGETQAAFIIPESFTKKILMDENGSIEMFQLNLNEASFTLKIQINQVIQLMQNSIQTVKNQEENPISQIAQLEKLIQQQQKQFVSGEVTDYKLYANPALYLITGFLLMFMMGLVNSSVSTVLEDRKQMTLTRMYAAPVRSYEIIIGNFMGSMFLGMIQIIAVLLLTKYILHFNYGVSLVSHFIILTFFLLAIMGLASAIAGLVRNSANVGAINSLIITPTCMIGGCFWPIEIMPDFLQKLANFVPQKWTIDAITRMSTGESLIQVGMNLAILGLFAVILLAFGLAFLKPSEN